MWGGGGVVGQATHNQIPKANCVLGPPRPFTSDNINQMHTN